MKIAYRKIRLGADRLGQVTKANDIIAEYQAQGFALTVRQLYYQFVSRDLIANTPASYKRLANLINDGRMAGLIDWDAIEDRTRSLASLPTWAQPIDILESCAQQFRTDLWADQSARVQVWIEKEALAGVAEPICNTLRVPYLSCRGFTSQSEMHEGGRRLREWAEAGQDVVILHLGDHDPSGIDMSRDIQERLSLFMGPSRSRLTFKRIALNMDQIEALKPPPNPAKATDSRWASYAKKFGSQSWELDALAPTAIADLIRQHVDNYRDETQWSKSARAETAYREQIAVVADRWDEVCAAVAA